MKALAITISLILLFSSLTVAVAADTANPSSHGKRDENVFGVPLEFAYVFVILVVIAVLIYAGGQWLFKEEF